VPRYQGSAGPGVAASWTYTAAAEDLIRALTGPPGEREAYDRADLAGRLRAIEKRCTPDETQVAAAGPQAPMPTTRAALDVARMATAITLLHQQENARSSPRNTGA
jgi:hypothetical protein